MLLSNNKVQLKIGQSVVFNQSGDVVPGIITKFKKYFKYGVQFTEVHIEINREDPTGEVCKTIAKVRNMRGIHVLKELT